MIAIKNNSTRDFVDMFDGISHTIPAGKIAKIPKGAASLWFGIGGNDSLKIEAMRRRNKLTDTGWLGHFQQMKIVEEYVSEPSGRPVESLAEQVDKLTKVESPAEQADKLTKKEAVSGRR